MWPTGVGSIIFALDTQHPVFAVQMRVFFHELRVSLLKILVACKAANQKCVDKKGDKKPRDNDGDNFKRQHRTAPAFGFFTLAACVHGCLANPRKQGDSGQGTLPLLTGARCGHASAWPEWLDSGLPMRDFNRVWQACRTLSSMFLQIACRPTPNVSAASLAVQGSLLGLNPIANKLALSL